MGRKKEKEEEEELESDAMVLDDDGNGKGRVAVAVADSTVGILWNSEIDSVGCTRTPHLPRIRAPVSLRYRAPCQERDLPVIIFELHTCLT